MSRHSTGWLGNVTSLYRTSFMSFYQRILHSTIVDNIAMLLALPTLVLGIISAVSHRSAILPSSFIEPNCHYLLETTCYHNLRYRSSVALVACGLSRLSSTFQLSISKPAPIQLSTPSRKRTLAMRESIKLVEPFTVGLRLIEGRSYLG